MMLDDILEIKVHNSNKSHYEKFLNREVTIGEKLSIAQNQLPLASRVKVKCKCDLCGKVFTRVRKDVRETTLCSKECRNTFLTTVSPTKDVEKVTVNCNICNKEIEVPPSKYKKQEHFLCSRECYKLHRSQLYKGDNLYNYQNTLVKCSNDDCNNEFKTIKFDLENRKNLFCSPECYWEHRSNHFSELYSFYDLNGLRKETNPERKVREYLEKTGINFIPEYNIIEYYLDFYLPDYNVAIEVYGDYWHCNPEVYGEDKRKIHNNQLRFIEHDLHRNKKLSNYLNAIYIIWEKQINEDFDNVMGNIIEKILNKNP